MRNLDYNKIMCVVGILFIIAFCIVLIIDYNSYSIFNSTPFSVTILVRTVEFWLPGAILIYLYNQNTNLKDTKYTVVSNKLPQAFNGYKIAHISDFHNTNSKRIKTKIKEALNKNKADIIVITGDLIDSRRTNILNAKEFLKDIVNIAPVYYVLGNHESRLRDIQNLINEAQAVGVKVLRNVSVKINKDDENIQMLGIDDAAFYIPFENSYEAIDKTENILNLIVKDSNNFKILLAHRPELIDVYSKHELDLVFTGHAHGGQMRLPLIGGIIAPGQGFFPKYTKGVYKGNNTQMVLSRGIGNSKFPFRINNRPEIITVTLKNKV